MRLILLGAPGAGKGTQAKKITAKFGITHISTGDILRAEISNKTELGSKAQEFVSSGKLVPDDLILAMIKDRFKAGDLEKGFLMDGFPRTIEQAEKFDSILEELKLKLDRVINIVLDKNEIIKRITNRIVCNSCKKVFKLADFSDKELKCDSCNSVLSKRADDSEVVIVKRLEVYEMQTKPLIEYYSRKNLLANVDGQGTEEEIFERILSHL
ncbi:MAG TPA: adenylate kinase [Actinobacteria bacterium]|nr:adenylate kinase [Actinomycetota bacterium]